MGKNNIKILIGDLEFSELKSLIKDYKSVILAYSFMTHQKVKIYKEWELIKENFKDVLIVAGGPHPSAEPKEALKNGADFVCSFDGEDFFTDLFDHLDKEKKKIFIGRCSNWEERFPFPQKRIFFSPIEITRGCPFGCSYCQTPLLKGKKVRHKKLEVIIEAVKFMVKYKAKDVRFISPNALSYGSCDGRSLNLNAVEDLLFNIRKALPKDGRIFFGSFPSEVRPEFINEDSVRIIKKYCDNKRVVFGAQSGSPRMLKMMRRGHSVEDVKNAVSVLIKHKIEPVVDFIVGLPDERDEDLFMSLKLMEELGKMGAKVHLHYFMPLPGSLWRDLKPTKLPEWALKRINKLISSGKLFGQWQRQIAIAEGS